MPGNQPPQGMPPNNQLPSNQLPSNRMPPPPDNMPPPHIMHQLRGLPPPRMRMPPHHMMRFPPRYRHGNHPGNMRGPPNMRMRMGPPPPLPFPNGSVDNIFRIKKNYLFLFYCLIIIVLLIRGANNQFIKELWGLEPDW